MDIRNLVVGSLLGASIVFPARAADIIEYDVVVAPPPARFEIAPEARPGYAWEQGYWRYDGRDYTWEPGHFIVDRHGHEYIAPAWEQQGPRWHFRAGHWDDD